MRKPRQLEIPDPPDKASPWMIAVTHALRMLTGAQRRTRSLERLTRADLDELKTVFGKELKFSRWTPDVSSFTGTLTTVSDEKGSYVRIGPIVFFICSWQIVTNGTGAGHLIVTLPPELGNILNESTAASGSKNDQAMAVALVKGGRNLECRLYDGTYPGQDGALYGASGIYEVGNK